MKKISIFITLIFMAFMAFMLQAEITSSKWKFYDGTAIVDEFDLEQECIDELNAKTPQEVTKTYNCEFRYRRVVEAEIIPDPVDPPPVTQNCDATIGTSDNINSSFSLISDGQTLCLNDGVYNQQVFVPSNKHLAAKNAGLAELDGQSSIGGSKAILNLEGNNSSATGLKVHHAGFNARTCMIKGTNNTLKLMSCSHAGGHVYMIPLGVSGSGHLIEDSWFYGKGRYLAICYEGNNITFRRNVGRWDETNANEVNQPNATFSNYSCNEMIWENNISLDYAKPATRMPHCGDFCLSTNYNEPNLNVKYFGNIVINHNQDTDNNVAFRADQKGSIPSDNILFKDSYAKDSETFFKIRSTYATVTNQNCTAVNVGSIGGKGSGGAAYNCNNDADISVRYVNGVKTTEPLFPFQHEALIKQDMCGAGERQSDWCNTSQSLFEYITAQ